MPGGGSRPGKRRGGRTKGTPNVAKKSEAEAAQRLKDAAAKVAAETGADPKIAEAAVAAALLVPVRKSLLEKFRDEVEPAVWGTLAHFQKKCTVEIDGVLMINEASSSYPEFKEWTKIYSQLGFNMMPYLHPSLKAIAVTDMGPRPPAESPRRADNVVDMKPDPIRAGRLYAQFMQAPRQMAAPSPQTGIAAENKTDGGRVS